jgi:hypothetical protein
LARSTLTGCEITAVRYDTDGLTFACGTATVESLAQGTVKSYGQAITADGAISTVYGRPLPGLPSACDRPN